MGSPVFLASAGTKASPPRIASGAGSRPSAASPRLPRIEQGFLNRWVCTIATCAIAHRSGAGTMPTRCTGCGDAEPLGFGFTMAFQPIVDVEEGAVWGYEALVRGANGESALHVLSQVNEHNRYRFDQACRVRAIEMAATLSTSAETRLSINFMPNAVYEPAACLRATLLAAERTGFDPTRIMFEFTENEPMEDAAHVNRIITEYRRHGFITAIDDFGAGYSGLRLLANFQPDLIKIDMDLVRAIHTSPAKRAIVAGVVGMARALDIAVLAEGVESLEEAIVLRAAGIRLMQGYHFARPAISAMPTVDEARMPRAA